MSHCAATVGEGVWSTDLDLHDSKVVAHALARTPPKGIQLLSNPDCPSSVIHL